MDCAGAPYSRFASAVLAAMGLTVSDAVSPAVRQRTSPYERSACARIERTGQFIPGARRGVPHGTGTEPGSAVDRQHWLAHHLPLCQTLLESRCQVADQREVEFRAILDRGVERIDGA